MTITYRKHFGIEHAISTATQSGASKTAKTFAPFVATQLGLKMSRHVRAQDIVPGDIMVWKTDDEIYFTPVLNVSPSFSKKLSMYFEILNSNGRISELSFARYAICDII